MINLMPLRQQSVLLRIKRDCLIVMLTFLLFLVIYGLKQTLFLQAVITQSPTHPKFYHFLNDLPQYIPKDMYLTHIVWAENKGRISGQAYYSSVITDFVNALENNPYVENVELVKHDDQYYFTVHFYD